MMVNKIYNYLAEAHYPVGSIYMTSTNTDPATILGFGTWSLQHKYFSIKNQENIATWNTTNITTTNAGSVMHRGPDVIILRLYYNNKVAFADTTLPIATIPLDTLGYSSLIGIYGQAIVNGGDGIGCVYFSVSGTNLQVQNYDILTATTATSIAAGKNWWLTVLLPAYTPAMLDSACNQFVWQRTA